MAEEQEVYLLYYETTSQTTGQWQVSLPELEECGHETIMGKTHWATSMLASYWAAKMIGQHWLLKEGEEPRALDV